MSHNVAQSEKPEREEKIQEERTPSASVPTLRKVLSFLVEELAWINELTLAARGTRSRTHPLSRARRETRDDIW